MFSRHDRLRAALRRHRTRRFAERRVHRRLIIRGTVRLRVDLPRHTLQAQQRDRTLPCQHIPWHRPALIHMQPELHPALIHTQRAHFDIHLGRHSGSNPVLGLLAVVDVQPAFELQVLPDEQVDDILHMPEQRRGADTELHVHLRIPGRFVYFFGESKVAGRGPMRRTRTPHEIKRKVLVELVRVILRARELRPVRHPPNLRLLRLIPLHDRVPDLLPVSDLRRV